MVTPSAATQRLAVLSHAASAPRPMLLSVRLGIGSRTPQDRMATTRPQ